MKAFGGNSFFNFSNQPGRRGLAPSTVGFTLIELIMVISIISLLASIVLTSVRASREKTIRTAIVSEGEQVVRLAAVDWLAKRDYSNITIGLVDSIEDCLALSGLSEQATQIQMICEGMFYRGLTVNEFNEYMYIVGNANDRGFALRMLLPGNGNTFYCRNSNGLTSIGPKDPGSGAWTAPGCSI